MASRLTTRRWTWSEAVYAAVSMIPRGRVATYGQIAALLGRPRGGREVGWALHGCRDPRVPCHRVVDRNGRLAPGFCEQRARLRDEGVPFREEHVFIAGVAWRPARRELVRLGREIERAAPY